MSIDTVVDTARSLWVLWLMLLFLGIVAWVMWPRNAKKIEDHGRIPFKDEEH